MFKFNEQNVPLVEKTETEKLAISIAEKLNRIKLLMQQKQNVKTNIEETIKNTRQLEEQLKSIDSEIAGIKYLIQNDIEEKHLKIVNGE